MSSASSSKSKAWSSFKLKASSSKSTEFKFSKTIMEKCCDDAALVLFTPFVVCLASGVLDVENFRNFIAQDVHFLRAFATAFEIAEDCTDDDDAKNAFAYMRDTISQELKKFDSFVQDWDSDLIKQSPLNPATTKYIDFLSAITSGTIDVTEDAPPIILCTPFEKTRIAPYVLAAVASCMRFYLAIGSKLKDCPSDHPYKRWVDKYSSTSYEISVQLPEELLDVLSVSLTTGELETVEKIYQHAMRLKMEFFNSQTPSQRTVIPLCKELNPEEWHLLLFSAFDLTCSKTDSSATLGQLCIEIESSKQHQNQPGSEITAPSSSDLKKTWNSLSKMYTVEYLQRFCRAVKCEKASKFSYGRLCKALEILSDFEKRAAGRVINSGILKGVNLEHINKVGEVLHFQDGCKSFLRDVLQMEDLHVNVYVLSFCWCGDLIRSAFSSAGLQAVNVLSNELVYDNSVTTGDIAMKFESPFDKIKEFDNICEGFKDNSNNNNNKKKLTVYIGDSVRDLLCLLKADIGIVIGSDGTLRKMGDQFGASFVPLFNGLVWKQRAFKQGNSLNWNGLSGLLYTASSWAEIRAFILGGLQAVNVHSNELIYDDSVTTGDIAMKIKSPFDMIKAFNNHL